MGVCTEERPVMHWQQSARFLGPRIREKSLTSSLKYSEKNNCANFGSEGNRHPLLRSCSPCHDASDDSKKQFVKTSNDSYCYKMTDFANFDKTSIIYTDRKDQSDCNKIREKLNAEGFFKTEPFQPPSSPESSSEPATLNENVCAGCADRIKDRFYLSAVEKRWHVHCLQCSTCRQNLNGESSCFSRDGKIFCKSDYFRLFGTRRCSRCLASISPNELVMRSKNLVFHVSCFFCTICRLPLTKGDQYGIVDALIYCRNHYNSALEVSLSTYSYGTHFSQTQSDTSHLQSEACSIVPNSIYIPTAQVISGLSQPPRQKGRPRKRKPKEIEALSANMDLGTEYLDFGRGQHMNASSRTKRMRTSFKHHQLRTMKSYFAINHNPDAKDLKQLSQKTGLPKRVLQVWFQNARAKWRRMMMKHDNTIIIEKGEGSLDIDSISTHSPNSFIMGVHGGSPSHSPD